MAWRQSSSRVGRSAPTSLPPPSIPQLSPGILLSSQLSHPTLTNSNTVRFQCRSTGERKRVGKRFLKSYILRFSGVGACLVYPRGTIGVSAVANCLLTNGRHLSSAQEANGFICGNHTANRRTEMPEDSEEVIAREFLKLVGIFFDR
ncbi:hypothetical protein NPIL_334971 [Nephila pilipes]|uniref:Uncharacterized protein n=1 Tax=Nephila pilipes TaxID=299642 RepID=A0A8X6NHY1_NEPPI|nr:hypothetical protein NPIL_334971 [Nephila pilipes]